MIDRYFEYFEARKASDRFLLLIVIGLLVAGFMYTLFVLNAEHKTTIATDGGILTEGVIGTPRFANPVLAITRGDQDIVALLYSGLLTISEDGSLTPDLAESVTVSDDGLVYNIVMRDDKYFHDGVKVTAEDVAYTIGLIQNPTTLKSPLRGNWNDVVVELINEKELNLVLGESYTPFIENLTVGILPKHIWGELSIEQLPFSQNNTEPIGSGPYALLDVDHNKSGLIDSMTLSAFPKGDNTAKISTIVLDFYSNEEELLTGFEKKEFLSTAALSPETLGQVDPAEYQIIEQPLPRVFSVFLNQNKSAVVRDADVRKALSAVIDRKTLIEYALDGYGVPTKTPIPPSFLAVESQVGTSTLTQATTTEVTDIRYAEELLIDAGWEQQDDRTWIKEIDDVPTKLAITITTVNTEVFEKTAEYIKTAWEELGVEVSIALFEQSDLVQVIIRPRDYEALLFGVDVGRALDLYPFWHSSQKDDPGLNVSLYANITTDDLLETARTTRDEEERIESVRAFEQEVLEETPAIFLYSPSFTYVIRDDITVSPMNRIVRASERFSNVHLWHMNESNVWPIFTD